MNLLHLSVLFFTDRLTEELTSIIEANFKSSRYVVDIWLTAMNLGLFILRDVFFAACLDYFEELPPDKFIHLENHNLLKLLNNKNISSTFLSRWLILRSWMEANKVSILFLNI